MLKVEEIKKGDGGIGDGGSFGDVGRSRGRYGDQRREVSRRSHRWWLSAVGSWRRREKLRDRIRKRR